MQQRHSEQRVNNATRQIEMHFFEVVLWPSPNACGAFCVLLTTFTHGQRGQVQVSVWLSCNDEVHSLNTVQQCNVTGNSTHQRCQCWICIIGKQGLLVLIYQTTRPKLWTVVLKKVECCYEENKLAKPRSYASLKLCPLTDLLTYWQG